MPTNEPSISFAAFFLLWAEQQNWEVPDIHIAICHWLEHRGRLGVLEVFRGCGKSTILAVYNAWQYYIDPTFRILHQGDQDATAYKTSRDTKNVLQRHPLTKKLGKDLKGDVAFWWLAAGFGNDPRNPSMQAAGILSNITSSRADEIQNDDVEVQKNVETPEAREKLRHRLSEQVHIAVPGARRLFVGTPHTHNSLYDELVSNGAELLKIPMFGKEQRFEETSELRFTCKFKPDLVFAGIGKHSQGLVVGQDYTFTGNVLTLLKPVNATLDLYADCAWPERFTHEEMLLRRRDCRTFNEWDSQYQLHAKPVGELRLNPEKIIPYDLQPIIKPANKRVCMWLGNVLIESAVAYWDCALGKIHADASAFSLLLTDAVGRLYLQVCQGLIGDLDEQCKEVRKLVVQYQIPRVVVETNGPGGFVPPALRKHLAGTGCGVTEEFSTVNKNKRILDALEAPIDAGFLWAHVDVLNGPIWAQMQEWNPKITQQPDDYLDSAAGAVRQTPVRIGKTVGNPTEQPTQNWRTNNGQFEIQLVR